MRNPPTSSFYSGPLLPTTLAPFTPAAKEYPTPSFGNRKPRQTTSLASTRLSGLRLCGLGQIVGSGDRGPRR